MTLFAKNMIYTNAYIHGTMSVEDILKFFKDSTLKFIPVLCAETIGRAIGFISHDRLLNLISTKYGYALYENKTALDIMDTEFLEMEIHAEIIDIVSFSMDRNEDQIYDDIVITENGFFSGLVSIKDIVTKQMEHIVYKNRHIDLQNQTLKEADYQIRQSESKYKLLFENGVNAVMVIDMDGVLAKVNSRFCQLIGCTSAEIEDTVSVMDLLHPDERSIAAKRFLKVQKNYFVNSIRAAPILNNIEFRLNHKNGSERIVECAMRYLPQTKQIICSLNDITEKKYFEERLLQSEKLSAIGSMLTGITHELNNQLTPILGYVDIVLSEENDLNIKTARRLRVLRRSAATASNIVNTLLRYAKPKHLNLKLTDINQLLSDNLALLKYHEGFHWVKIQLETSADLPLCELDESQIGQVFLNVLINSLQAMETTGGILTVSTRFEENFVSVNIRDTGKGISQSNLQKVFEPFFTTKSPDKGTGLGLSVSYSIIKAHNGDIEVQSQLGKGTEFRIKLPVRPQMEKQLEKVLELTTTPAVLDHSDRSNEILLIEDDEPIREMAEEILKESILCNVTAVSDGRAALDYLDNGRNFDLILSDLRMPHMNGFQLYEWMTRHRPDLSSRVIFLTGDTYDIKTREFMMKHDLQLLFKPFELNHFVQAVKTKLEQQIPPMMQAEALA